MKNSTIGILSICFGLLGFFTAYWYIGIIPCIIAIIFGIVGLMDYLAYKWSSVMGLICACLGVALFIYAVVADIGAGNLIIACDKGDFLYVSNVDESDALDEYAEILASARIKAAEKKLKDGEEDTDDIPVAEDEQRRDTSAENIVVVDRTADNEEAASSDDYVKGINYGTYWESKWLGMRYDQPSGFTMLSDSQLDEANQMGNELVSVLVGDDLASQAQNSVFELMAMSNTGIPNFNLSVERTSSSVDEYMSATGQQLQNIYGSSFEDRGFEGTEEIGGKYFQKYTYVVSDGGSTMYQVCYITKKDDRIVDIILTYTEETKGEADTLMSGFSEL